MKKTLYLVLLSVAMTGFVAANDVVTVPTVPEIGPGTAATALALLSGAVLVIRSRRK